MKYLVGMDGGGTKTACVVTDQNKNILFECTGGPSNFLMQGTEKVSEMLFGLLSKCREELKAEYSDFISIALGTTGAGRRNDAEKLEESFLTFAKNKGIAFNFYVDSDARIALEGAFSGKPGSILIAGTGSIMFGKDAYGQIHRVGGFGRWIGDEGSGFYIGKCGLSAAAKEFDGRGESTLFSKLLKEKKGITTSEQLITEIYKNNFDIASVAPFVIQAAENSDEVCNNILSDQCDEILLHIHAMMKNMKVSELDLSLIGGILSTDNYFARIFRDEVSRQIPGVNIKLPDLPPAMGAVLMAENKLV